MFPSIDICSIDRRTAKRERIDTEGDRNMRVSTKTLIGCTGWLAWVLLLTNMAWAAERDQSGLERVLFQDPGMETPAMTGTDKQIDMDARKDYSDRSMAQVYRPGQRVGAEEPFRLKPGPYLFIDDFLIESGSNVRRVVNKPVRDPNIPNPIVTGKEDGCFQPYMTVVRDPDTKRFRLWYGHRVEDYNAGGSHIGYLESEDGIHWERPAQVLADPAPIQFGVSVIDEGKDYPKKDRRYKYGWYMDGGLKVASSPDGYNWTPLKDSPVVYHNHDITGIFHDPLRSRYIAILSVYRQGEDWSGNRRITMQSQSANLIDWATPHYVVLPDPSVDEGETQFYAMDGFLARGNLLIGMVKVLRDDLKADNPPDPPDAYGVGYTTLAWTRDGETWVRDTEHFFDPQPEKGTWDHAHAWIDEQVLVGDEVFLYYGGYARGHKVNRFEERQIGLVKVGRDRYAGWEAEKGHIRTPLLLLQGDALTLNVDAAGGRVKVQVLDKDDKPIPGFTFDDCESIGVDSLKAAVRWEESLSGLKGKTIRLEFNLKNARLYAMNIE